jgi:hypothetical protein
MVGQLASLRDARLRRTGNARTGGRGGLEILSQE